jgi:hypothetical protein
MRGAGTPASASGAGEVRGGAGDEGRAGAVRKPEPEAVRRQAGEAPIKPGIEGGRSRRGRRVNKATPNRGAATPKQVRISPLS